jgi:hypothetical protein
MSHHSSDVWMWVNIWCYCAGILWPLTWIFSSKKPLSDAEKWEVFHEVCATPQLMADGVVMQRIEWRYVPYEAQATGGQARPAPPAIRVGGRELQT